MSIISIGIPVPDRSALPGQTGSGEEVNLQYATQNYCADSSNPSPTVATPAGGTFSYAPGGISGGANGQIVIANSTPGNYIVTYTVTGVGSANFPINITALDNATFSYSASAFCADASNQTPTITTPGGTFTTQDITFRPFQMQFDTSGGKTISIPGVYGTSFTIDWGDGFTETSTGGGNRTISHTYASGIPTSTVSIGATGDTGAFTKFAFNNSGSKSDLLDVPQWGSVAWTTFNSMFRGCNNSNFQISATDYPDMSNSTDMQLMFFNATHFNSNIDHWDVSTITNLSGCFRDCNNYNQSLNSWDVLNVTNFSSMFINNFAFNGNISNWDMSSCETTANMFYSNSSFNQDISGWSFSNNWVDANQMFFSASSFNQNLGSWNVSSVLNMGGMFRGCTNFNNNGGTLSAWNVSSVTTMLRMFQQATSFVGTGLDSWNPSSCTDFAVLFYLTSFNQNLNSWSLNSSLISVSSMFHPSSMSQANYTDTLVGWANTVFTNSAPYSVNFTGNSFSTKFDGTRTYNSGNFSTAQDAYNYLIGATASWSIN